MFLMIVVAIILVALLLAFLAMLGQSTKMLWSEAGKVVHGSNDAQSTLTGDLKRDSMAALGQLGLTGKSIEDYVDKAISLCPDCSLQSIVNLVVQMRNANGGK